MEDEDLFSKLFNSTERTIGSLFDDYEKPQNDQRSVSDIPTWMNPMNWGVEDYSDEARFGSAFAGARQQGEEQFMWKGNRYNTKSDMSLRQQQQVYGNSDVGLEAEVASFLNPRERASQTIAPRELTGKSFGYIAENYIEPFVTGETPSGNVLTKESIPAHYGEDNIDPQIDMFRKYMGLEQHFDTIRESPYSEGDYDFSEGYRNKMIRDLKESYGGFGGVVKAHQLEENNPKVVFDHKTRSYQEAQETGKPYTGEATTLYPMGRYTESLKRDDETGENYISYRDKFDLNPQALEQIGMGDVLNKFNEPFDIQGRIYESDFNKEGMYYNDEELTSFNSNEKNFDTLALQRELSNRGYDMSHSRQEDGSFDGIWGDKTQQTLRKHQMNKTLQNVNNLFGNSNEEFIRPVGQ